jgi:hypothetical protein
MLCVGVPTALVFAPAAGPTGGTAALPGLTGLAAAEVTPFEDQHFYFLNGCVFNPLDCGLANRSSWEEYYQALGAVYVRVQNLPGLDNAHSAALYAAWADTHIFYLSARTAPEGAAQLDDLLHQDTETRVVHLTGTSVGGASIFSYFSQAMRGEVSLDSRLRDAVVVDAPLGFQFPLTADNLWSGIAAGFVKSDVQPGLGAWARRQGLRLLTVATPDDIVIHDPLPDVPIDAAPQYRNPDTPPRVAPGLACRGLPCAIVNVMREFIVRNAWHLYTGGHSPDSVRAFYQEIAP